MLAHWWALGVPLHLFGALVPLKERHGCEGERVVLASSLLVLRLCALQPRCEAARLPHANAVPARGAPAALRVSFQALR